MVVAAREALQIGVPLLQFHPADAMEFQELFPVGGG